MFGRRRAAPEVSAMHALETTVALPAEHAERAVRAALAAQGFGVLTEIDVSAVLHAKLGVERPPLKILGACNPALADAALQHDTDAALVLPCNVVIEPIGAETTRIRIVDPRELIADPALAGLAGDAAARLTAALHALTDQPAGPQ